MLSKKLRACERRTLRAPQLLPAAPSFGEAGRNSRLQHFMFAPRYGGCGGVLGSCLRSDRQKECTFVKRNWKRLIREGRPMLEEISSNLGLGKSSPDEILLYPFRDAIREQL